MTQAEEIKKLKKRIVELNKECREWETTYDKIRDDRDRYRSKCQQYFKWFLKLLDEDKNPCKVWVIKDLTKLFNQCDRAFLDFGN